MSLETILSFTLIVTLLVISPGPNGALIFKTVPFQGKRNGVANVFGFLSAFYMHGIFSVFGLSALVVGSARAFFVVKALGALYLTYLGIKALWEAFRRQKSLQNMVGTEVPARQTLLSSYLEGLVTNLLNPKVSVFYLAAFPNFVHFDAGLSASIVGGAFGLVTIHALVNLVWFTGMVFVVGRTTTWAKSSWIGRSIKGVTGAVLLWFSYKLVTARSPS